MERNDETTSTDLVRMVLNPIELVWHELKHFLRKTWKPKTKNELILGIKTFWRIRMTKEKCNRYINI